MNKLLLTASCIALMTASAYAADLPSRTHAAMAPVTPRPVFTWTGFYVGMNAGMVAAQGQTDAFWNGPSNHGVAQTYKSSSKGGLFSADIGYNYQVNRIVVGAEADLGFASGNSKNDVIGGSGDLYGGIIYKKSDALKSFSTIRGRFGVVYDRALVYATAGVAFGQVKHSMTDTMNTLGGLNYAYPVNWDSYSSTKWSTGFVIGGGLEYAITDHWTVRGEALYVNFGKQKNNLSAAINGRINPCNTSFAAKDNTSATVARIGVNYKF